MDNNMVDADNLKKVEELPRYLIGSSGELWSIERQIFMSWYLSNSGYLMSKVRINNESKSIGQHQTTYRYYNEDYRLFNGVIYVIDHIDSNKINNSIENLRLVTFRENTSKERTINSNLPTGVTYIQKTNNYISRIYLNDRTYHLGVFGNSEEASLKYKYVLENYNNYNILPDQNRKIREINNLKCISFNKQHNKWRVLTSMLNGKRYFLGYYTTIEEAVITRDNFLITTKTTI